MKERHPWPTWPRWKRTLQVLVILYALVAWCLPVFLIPFVNTLPYVHSTSLLGRCLVSLACSTVIMGAVLVLHPGRYQSEPAKRIGALFGLLLFTFGGAHWSPNLFGSVAAALPSTGFSKTITLTAVAYQGVRHKTVEVSYFDPADDKLRYLVLTKRLYPHSQLRPGDSLEISGRATALGEYVEAAKRRYT